MSHTLLLPDMAPKWTASLVRDSLAVGFPSSVCNVLVSSVKRQLCVGIDDGGSICCHMPGTLSRIDIHRVDSVNCSYHPYGS